MTDDQRLSDASSRVEEAQRSFLERGDLDSVDRLVVALSVLADLTPTTSAEHGILIMQEASMLGERWARTRDGDSWLEALAFVDGWIDSVPYEDFRRALYLLAKGLLFYRRADATENSVDIAAAIDALEAARQRAKAGSGVHGTASTYLANLRSRRYEIEDAPADLEAAVMAGTAVLVSERAKPEEKYFSARTLIRMFTLRFERTGFVEDLDAAVHCSDVALSLAPNGSAKGEILGVRASALRSRFVQRRDPVDLDEAITAYRQSLEYADKAWLKAVRWDNLGNGLSTRFDFTGELADLEEAVRCGRSALELLPSDAPERPRTVANLGFSLIDLAAAGTTDALDEACELFTAALDAGGTSDEMAIRLRVGLAKATLAADAIGRPMRAGVDPLSVAIRALLEASELGMRGVLAKPAPYRLGQLDSVASLARPLVVALLRRAGAADDPSAADSDRRTAFVVGEASKAPLLAEAAMQHRLRPPPDIPSDLIDAEQLILTKLSALTARELVTLPGTTPGRQLFRIGQRAEMVNGLQSVWTQIAALSGSAASYVDTRSSMTATLLALLSDGPSVPIFSVLDTERTSVGLSARRGVAGLLWRPGAAAPEVVFDLDHDPFPDVVAAFTAEIPDDRGREEHAVTWWHEIAPLCTQVPVSDDQTTIVSPSSSAGWLPWALLLELAQHSERPADATGAPPALVTVPSVAIAVLPAAEPATVWHELVRTAADMNVDQADQDIIDSIVIWEPRSTEPTGLPLVVGDPTRDLGAASGEAVAVAAVLGVEPLLGSAATRRSVLDGLLGSPIVHIAAHTSFDPDDPLRSAIELSDGELTLGSMLAAWSSADVVVLSACEGASSARTHGGEILSVTAALLRAGVDTVVAGLWAVDDAATAYLMSSFHRLLATGETAAVSLARAQALTRAEPGWESPYYWAAFAVFGRDTDRYVKS